MASTSTTDQVRLLSVFGRRRFPLDHSVLLGFLGMEERVADAAATALARVQHADVRKLAFDLMASGTPLRRNAMAMLTRNWQPGDHTIALEWFRAEQDPDIQHRFEIDLRNLPDAHPGPDVEVAILEALYEDGPCGMCRDFIVCRLLELDALTPARRAECAFDSQEEIRETVKSN